MTSATPTQPANAKSIVAKQHMQAFWRSARMQPVVVVEASMFD